MTTVASVIRSAAVFVAVIILTLTTMTNHYVAAVIRLKTLFRRNVLTRQEENIADSIGIDISSNTGFKIDVCRCVRSVGKCDRSVVRDGLITVARRKTDRVRRIGRVPIVDQNSNSLCPIPHELNRPTAWSIRSNRNGSCHSGNRSGESSGYTAVVLQGDTTEIILTTKTQLSKSFIPDSGPHYDIVSKGIRLTLRATNLNRFLTCIIKENRAFVRTPSPINATYDIRG